MGEKESNKAGKRKLKNAIILRNDGDLLTGLLCNALASVVQVVVCKVN